jgi:hypothetical protein
MFFIRLHLRFHPKIREYWRRLAVKKSLRNPKHIGGKKNYPPKIALFRAIP